jgi:DNA-binding NarL/FixJ family response regulator
MSPMPAGLMMGAPLQRRGRTGWPGLDPARIEFLRQRSMRLIKLLLVDDEAIVRRGLRMRLQAESDIRVIGEAANGREALSLAAELQPDVVIIDVNLPQMSGIAATQALCARANHPAVVVLSIRDDANTRARARCAGAGAFLTKRGQIDELLAAIRQVSKKT